MAELEFQTEEAADSAVVTLAGDLDMRATFRLEQELGRLIEVERVSHVSIDLGGVTFIDSSGLSLIIATNDSARERDVDLALLPGPQQVQRVFELAGVSDILPFQDEEDAAP